MTIGVGDIMVNVKVTLVCILFLGNASPACRWYFPAKVNIHDTVQLLVHIENYLLVTYCSLIF